MLLQGNFPGKRFHELPIEYRGWRFCAICRKPFIRTSGAQRFCSVSCKSKEGQTTGSMCCERQYVRISGDWEKYFARLINRKRKGLITKQDLLEIIKKQDYKCALSGIPLTCQLTQGKKYKTNASLDRIIPGEPYTKENIQLVCAALNSWRGDTELDEFVEFCRQVTLFQDERRRVRAIQQEL